MHFISNKHPLLLLSEGLAGSSAVSYIAQRQHRRVSPTVRPVQPKSWSSPSLAQQHTRKAGASWEENKLEGVQHPSLNLPRMGLQLVLGMDSEEWSELTLQKEHPTWGRNSSLVPARVWVTVRKASKFLYILDATKFINSFFCSR